MKWQFITAILLTVVLAGCGKDVRIVEAVAHTGPAKDTSIEVGLDPSHGNAFTYGGYIRLYSCADAAEERFLPVEEITSALIKTSVTQQDGEWLTKRLASTKMCVSLYDGSGIASEVRSNTVPLTVSAV